MVQNFTLKKRIDPVALVFENSKGLDFLQRQLRLPPMPAGYHLITDAVVNSIPEIKGIQIRFLQVFIQHTSAALTINENIDPR